MRACRALLRRASSQHPFPFVARHSPGGVNGPLAGRPAGVRRSTGCDYFISVPDTEKFILRRSRPRLERDPRRGRLRKEPRSRRRSGGSWKRKSVDARSRKPRRRGIAEETRGRRAIVDQTAQRRSGDLLSPFLRESTEVVRATI